MNHIIILYNLYTRELPCRGPKTIVGIMDHDDDQHFIFC